MGKINELTFKTVYHQQFATKRKVWFFEHDSVTKYLNIPLDLPARTNEIKYCISIPEQNWTHVHYIAIHENGCNVKLPVYEQRISLTLPVVPVRVFIYLDVG